MVFLVFLQEVELLNGTWKLVYTSNSELMALLGLSRLPFVTVGDIIQRIDSLTLTVENQVCRHPPDSQLHGPPCRCGDAVGE